MATILRMRMVVEHRGDLTVYVENVVGHAVAMIGHGLDRIGIGHGRHVAPGRAPAPDQVSKTAYGIGVAHGEMVRFDPVRYVDMNGFGVESVAVFDIARPNDPGAVVDMIDFGHGVGVDSFKGGFGKHGFLSLQDKSFFIRCAYCSAVRFGVNGY